MDPYRLHPSCIGQALTGLSLIGRSTDYNSWICTFRTNARTKKKFSDRFLFFIWKNVQMWFWKSISISLVILPVFVKLYHMIANDRPTDLPTLPSTYHTHLLRQLYYQSKFSPLKIPEPEWLIQSILNDYRFLKEKYCLLCHEWYDQMRRQNSGRWWGKKVVEEEEEMW